MELVQICKMRFIRNNPGLNFSNRISYCPGTGIGSQTSGLIAHLLTVQSSGWNLHVSILKSNGLSSALCASVCCNCGIIPSVINGMNPSNNSRKTAEVFIRIQDVSNRLCVDTGCSSADIL